MIEVISNLVRDLAVIIFVATLLQLLVPQSDFRRYIRMVIGLIIILLLLAPLRTLIFFNRGVEPLLAFSDFQQEFEMSAVQQQETFAQRHHELVMQNLQKRIIAEAEKQLSFYNFSIQSAQVEIIEDKSDPAFGSIRLLHLQVQKYEGEEPGAGVISAVDPVRLVEPVLIQVSPVFEEEAEEGMLRLKEMETKLAGHFLLMPEKVIVKTSE